MGWLKPYDDVIELEQHGYNLRITDALLILFLLAFMRCEGEALSNLHPGPRGIYLTLFN